jgi:hypothetical protein
VSVTIYFIFTDEKMADWYLSERVIAREVRSPQFVCEACGERCIRNITEVFMDMNTGLKNVSEVGKVEGSTK